MDSGFLVSGTWIPDSNRLRDSGFLKMYIPRIPDYFISTEIYPHRRQ